MTLQKNFIDQDGAKYPAGTYFSDDLRYKTLRPDVDRWNQLQQEINASDSGDVIRRRATVSLLPTTPRWSFRRRKMISPSTSTAIRSTEGLRTRTLSRAAMSSPTPIPRTATPVSAVSEATQAAQAMNAAAVSSPSTAVSSTPSAPETAAAVSVPDTFPIMLTHARLRSTAVPLPRRAEITTAQVSAAKRARSRSPEAL